MFFRKTRLNAKKVTDTIIYTANDGIMKIDALTLQLNSVVKFFGWIIGTMILNILILSITFIFFVFLL